MKSDTIRLFNSVLLSCLQGYGGDWDCSTDEGREGFLAMADAMRRIATDLEIPINKAVADTEETWLTRGMDDRT